MPREFGRKIIDKDPVLGDGRGFTLIEAIVATALFAVTVSSIIGVYLYTVKINRRTDTIRSAGENARFISEFLTKEIRNGQIDYFGPAPSPCTLSATSGSSLAIINIDGDHECFYLSGTNLMVAKSAGGNLLAPVQLNDSKVKVSLLQFYLAPNCNPYSAGAKTEPTVTINAEVQANPDPLDNITLPIQTTISIPKYDFAPSVSC